MSELSSYFDSIRGGLNTASIADKVIKGEVSFADAIKGLKPEQVEALCISIYYKHPQGMNGVSGAWKWITDAKIDEYVAFTKTDAFKTIVGDNLPAGLRYTKVEKSSTPSAKTDFDPAASGSGAPTIGDLEGTLAKGLGQTVFDEIAGKANEIAAITDPEAAMKAYQAAVDSYTGADKEQRIQTLNLTLYYLTCQIAAQKDGKTLTLEDFRKIPAADLYAYEEKAKLRKATASGTTPAPKQKEDNKDKDMPGAAETSSDPAKDFVGKMIGKLLMKMTGESSPEAAQNKFMDMLFGWAEPWLAKFGMGGLFKKDGGGAPDTTTADTSSADTTPNGSSLDRASDGLNKDYTAAAAPNTETPPKPDAPAASPSTTA
jgi:hypothetical protein